jgi:hypothetical protein
LKEERQMGIKNSKGGKHPIDPPFREQPKDIIEDKNKILILGAGNQGKSVVFEQLRYLVLKQRGEQTDIIDGESAKTQIVTFAVENLKVLLSLLANKQAAGTPLSSAEPIDALKLSSEAQNARDELFNNDSKASVDGLATMVEILWNDPAVKRIYRYAAKEIKMEVSEHLEYVLDNLHSSIEPGSGLITREMLLKALPPTTGITEFNRKLFTMQGGGGIDLPDPVRVESREQTHFFQVGGKRQQRKVMLLILIGVDLGRSEMDSYFRRCQCHYILHFLSFVRYEAIRRLKCRFI